MDLSNLFQVVNFTEKDDPTRLKKRTVREYAQQMLIVDTSCVLQWPRNLTDETLIRRGRFESQHSDSMECVEDEIARLIHRENTLLTH